MDLNTQIDSTKPNSAMLWPDEWALPYRRFKTDGGVGAVQFDAIYHRPIGMMVAPCEIHFRFADVEGKLSTARYRYVAPDAYRLDRRSIRFMKRAFVAAS